MKKLSLLLTSLVACTYLYAQVPKEGALPTSRGFVVYVDNQDLESYTVRLEGDVGIENYPILRDDDVYFLIETAPKKVFGADDKSRLRRYMEMEYNKLGKSMQLIAKPESLTKIIDSTLFNLWSVQKPEKEKKEEEAKEVQVLKYYYLDFVIDETLFRIQHPATEIDDKAARVALYRIFRNMNFYKNLDISKLQSLVAQGQYSY